MGDDKIINIFKFGKSIKINDYMLFEMPQHIVDEMQELGRTGTGEFQIRGKPEDPAAFVTEDTTYSVRYLETSNTICLVEPQHTAANNSKEISSLSLATSTHSSSLNETSSDEPAAKKQRIDAPKIRKINGFVTGHYQMKKIQPRTHVLREMLLDNPYTGKDVEKKVESDYQSFLEVQDAKNNVDMSTQALREIIQASDTELYSSLKKLNALEVDGQWRVLDSDFMAEVFGQVLDTAIAENLSLDKLDAKLVNSFLDSQYDQSIVTHCIRMHSEVQEESQSELIFKLDNTKVCIFYLVKLFLEKEPWQQEKLLERWKDVVPYGMTPNIKMLSGIALSDESPHGGLEWRYVPKESLSPNHNERFEELFNLRARWEEDDIAPYVNFILNPGEKLDRVLLKYTRIITVDGKTVYCKQ